MVQYRPLHMLPTDRDLPDTDDQPVDNELQLLVPYLLRVILSLNWDNRMDWFFGVNWRNCDNRALIRMLYRSSLP